MLPRVFTLSPLSRAGLCALIFGLVLLCYFPALPGGLVWDDAAHVTRPELQSGAGLRQIWLKLGATQQYYPVLHSAFWLEHRLWGDATLGYHLVNVALHATACCLLAAVVGRLFRIGAPTGGKGPPRQPEAAGSSGAAATAWAAAGLFAVHPVCVESVAWISEQKNTLSLVFYLAAAWAYLEFHHKRDGRAYGLALALFILALGSKTVTATLPAALLVALWWRQGTLSWRRDVVPLLPWFAVGVAAGLFTGWVERTYIGAKGSDYMLTVIERGLLAGRIVWFYLGKLIWPTELMFVYPHWTVDRAEWVWWLSLGAAVALTVLLWWIRRRNRAPLAAWLFFVGSLVPALGFVNVYPFRFSYVADHFQYLPMIGVIVLMAAILSWVWDLAATAGRRFVVGLIFASVLVGLSAQSFRQSAEYRSSDALYRATLAKNPECWMAENNLGVELANVPGTRAEGIEHYRRAIALKPDYAESRNNLGVALAFTREGTPEAIEHFRAALQIEPKFVEARLNLANALVATGQGADAFAQLMEVLQQSPELPGAHYALGNLLARVPDRQSDAISAYQNALRLKPDFVEAHGGLANLLSRDRDRMAEALAHYEATLRLAPGLAKAHYNYATALENIPGREDDARGEYEEAVRLDPNYAEAHNNLGVFFARKGDYPRAREHWEAAARANPNFEDPRRNLEFLEGRNR